MRVRVSVGSVAAVQRKLEQNRDKTVDELAKKLLAGVRRRTPVDTGLAKASWERRTEGNDEVIVNTQPYTVFLDRGSSRQAPRGITRPAIRAVLTRRI